MEEHILHRAAERGHANNGWLDSYHSFSFANYYDSGRMHFGVLRVLNDDIIAGGGGFGLHPHDNMEIITIPFYGELEHKDSMGHAEVLRANDVQVMSAGTGLTHSEYNKNPDSDVNLVQVWIFPNKRNVVPRYDQKTFAVKDRFNKFQLILSPDGEGGSLWIHQEAWFYRASVDVGCKLDHAIRRSGNGAYLFVIEGEAEVNGQRLQKRDALGICNAAKLEIVAKTKAEVLLMDIPMELN